MPPHSTTSNLQKSHNEALNTDSRSKYVEGNEANNLNQKLFSSNDNINNNVNLGESPHLGKD